MPIWPWRKPRPAQRDLPLMDMLQHIVVPLFALDAQGRVAVWNAACAALTGLSAAEVLGTKEHWRGFYKAQRPCLADLVLAGSTGQANALYAAANAPSADGRAIAQNWCDLPSGTRCYLRIDAGPLRDAHGDTLYVVETLQDLTAVKEAEAALDSERDAAAREQALVVESLAQGLAALASGDLQLRLTKPFVAQYEKLRADFNATLARLCQTIRAVSSSAESVRGGVEEMQDVTADLAQGAGLTATALERTSASVNAVTATVLQTAEEAVEARRLVGEAHEEAARSGSVVGDAVRAMGQIEGSSKQISNIIGVIDEIAFQTNLLALNAGVEAARAGDAGRGFAVVATEVRGLAQRSADAAKEIKALITASGTQVATGVRLVGETGSALTRIVGQVEQLNGLMNSIAEAARAQTAGLGEVNAAMAQLGEVRQRNAAQIGQANATSQVLVQDAQALDTLMAQFQTGEAARQLAFAG